MKRVRKVNNLLGIKYLITSVAIAAVLGLWNYFAKGESVKSLASEESPPKPIEESANYRIEFPPLPTLIPVKMENSQQDFSVPSETTSLREILSPTPAPTEQVDITIQTIIIEQTSPGGGLEAGQPVIETGSSK
jgi:hypothetical protein